MITELEKNELIGIGSRYSGSGLVEQGGYTHGVALTDGSPLANLLPTSYLAEGRTLIDDVRERSKDREATEQESKYATAAQNLALRQAKTWMRKLNRRAKRAAHLGKKVPDTLMKSPSNVKMKEFCEGLDFMVKDFEKFASSIPGADNAALLTEGKTLANTLLTADFDQEVKRLNNLPLKVQDYYHNKGLLYKWLKVVNEAGRELHVNEPAHAEKYNMKILYRNYTNHKTEPKQEEAKA